MLVLPSLPYTRVGAILAFSIVNAQVAYCQPHSSKIQLDTVVSNISCIMYMYSSTRNSADSTVPAEIIDYCYFIQSSSLVAVFTDDIIVQVFDAHSSLCSLVNEFEKED